MLNESAAQWVKALRRGDYPQGQGYMRYGNRYDVLGVACDVYAKSHPGVYWTKPADDSGAYQILERSFALPTDVQEWLNLFDHIAGFATAIEDCTSLVDLNDIGWSFDQIAGFIESAPEGLFLT